MHRIPLRATRFLAAGCTALLKDSIRASTDIFGLSSDMIEDNEGSGKSIAELHAEERDVFSCIPVEYMAMHACLRSSSVISRYYGKRQHHGRNKCCQ